MCSHQICLGFDNDEHYMKCVNDPGQYREFLAGEFARHPEIFPYGFAEGYEFHSRYYLSKQALWLRRIKLTATQEIFAIRPSSLLPYGVGRTDAVEKALYLRQWGVPFEALSYVFGGSASHWERMYRRLGDNVLLTTTVKSAKVMPHDLTADEKITWLNGQEVSVAMTAGAGCLLGVAIANTANAEHIESAYAEFKDEAHQLDAHYTPQSVCTDGFAATRLAWRRLFPKTVIVLCFLHGILKIIERCRGQLRQSVLDRAWNCYRATTPAAFSQRLRRLKEWSLATLSGALQQMTLKLHEHRRDYIGAYACSSARRTTNAVDRLMNWQDRLLYAMGYLRGAPKTARLMLHAMALQWNFHPYSARLRRADPSRRSPFADLNGFQYHDNWLHNLLIAASMGGHRTPPT